MSTHNIPCPNIKRKSSKKVLNLQPGDFFSKGLKSRFEAAVVRSLKYYCICQTKIILISTKLVEIKSIFV